jgi:outer membrane lipoprotein carrier protein
MPVGLPPLFLSFGGSKVMEIRARVGWGLLMLLFVLLGGGVSWALTPEEIADGIQKYYKQIRDLEADFQQETTLPMMNRVSEASGHLYLKIPGKMRWDYVEGQKKTVVINDQTMWFYEPEDKQVTVTDLARVPNSQDLLTFLTGVGDLRKTFRLDATQSTQENKDGYVMIHLLPRAEASQWTHLRLSVDPKNFQVVQTAFEGAQGDRTVLTYRNIRTDVGLSDDLFAFKIPEGTDVLHYPPPKSTP